METDIYGRDAQFPYRPHDKGVDHDDTQRIASAPLIVGIDPRTIKCDECKARPRHRCKDSDGNDVEWVHQAREDKARDYFRPPEED